MSDLLLECLRVPGQLDLMRRSMPKCFINIRGRDDQDAQYLLPMTSIKVALLFRQTISDSSSQRRLKLRRQLDRLLESPAPER